MDALGDGVHDVTFGDDVAVFLPGLGRYAEHVVADFWIPKPSPVSRQDTAALSASGEAAARTLA